MNAGSRIKNRMQKLRGTLRRKNAKGSFYYRLTVANGVRKEFALKTTDELEALQRAEELDSIWAAPTMDVAVAQINAMKGYMYHLLYLILRVQCYSPGIDNMSHIACMEMLPVAFFLATDDA